MTADATIADRLSAERFIPESSTDWVSRQRLVADCAKTVPRNTAKYGDRAGNGG
jgi:hypothetical protein